MCRKWAVYVIGMLAVCGCILYAVLTSPYSQSASQDYSDLIYDEYGTRLESIFVDISPNHDIRENYVQNEDYLRSCQDNHSYDILGISYVLDWFNLQDVHAQYCYDTPCMGHYMESTYYHCSYICGDIYKNYFSDPNDDGSNYHHGYNFSGNTECCGTVCAEVRCYQ